MIKSSAMTASAGFAGLVTGMLALGAQFALGSDLTFGSREVAAQQTQVNREAKADRLVMPAKIPSGTTLSFRVPTLPDTLVVTRIPQADAGTAPDNMSLRVTTRPAAGKRQVACEPPVSVLTEVAKLLEPSRCVT